MTREEITILLVKAHYGLLEPAEQATAEALLRESAVAREVKRELDELTATDAFLSEAAVADTWQQLAPRVREAMGGAADNAADEGPAAGRKARRLWLGVAAAAAAVLLFVTAALFFWKPADLPPPHLATLTLGNGKILPLQSTGTQYLDADGATIANTDRVLYLDAADAGAPVTWNTLTVPRTLDYKILLPDSSIVWLNSTTVLRFPSRFADGVREVYLEGGEAYFEISRDTEAPFTVHTPQGEVRVLGTAFNINAYQPGQVLTALVSGRVAVGYQGQRATLSPMQQAVVTDGAPEIRIQPFDLANTVSWREGIHYFSDAPVAELAVMLERWFDTRLVLDNDSVGHVQFRGKLDRNRPLQEFIDAINLTGDAEFYWKDGVLHGR